MKRLRALSARIRRPRIPKDPRSTTKHSLEDPDEVDATDPNARLQEPDGYEAKRSKAAARSRALSRSGRDIGELPAVEDSKRKEACRQDLRRFLETYFPDTFALAWSEDHLDVIGEIEKISLEGGQRAIAMPRGSGKTSICERAAIWAMAFGHRRFVALIAASEKHAVKMLSKIKRELDNNGRLAADFPEVCHAIRKLDGIATRCAGQTYKGERTQIAWNTSEIVLPTIPGSPASGAIVMVAGLTGAVRGMSFLRPDGATARPDLALVDDPQTRESAKSLSQCVDREEIIQGDVLGLAGPQRKLAVVMPCTVIAPGDVADSLLNRELHPDWNGLRKRMMYAFPSNTKLWEEYADLRADSLRRHGDIREATAFYRANQAAMDEGARVAWKARFDADEISAIQHAMNLKLKNEASFLAEYQNDPRERQGNGDVEKTLTADQFLQKLSGFPRGVVPNWAEILVSFWDVQDKLLYWKVLACRTDFTGAVVDYGTYPDQGRSYFTLDDSQFTLQVEARKAGVSEGGREAYLRAGLDALADLVLGREWMRENGEPMRIRRCLIDANWGESTDVVYSFCRSSKYAPILYPSHGKYVGASSVPMRDAAKKPGDKVGHNWRIPSAKGKRSIRAVIFDANFYKSLVHARFAVPKDGRGSFSLFGTQAEARVHRMLADHLTSEVPIRTTGRGRTLSEWKQRPDRKDNHFWDCIVGCAVAASIEGAALPETEVVKAAPKAEPISLAALQRERRANGLGRRY